MRKTRTTGCAAIRQNRGIVRLESLDRLRVTRFLQQIAAVVCPGPVPGEVSMTPALRAARFAVTRA